MAGEKVASSIDLRKVKEVAIFFFFLPVLLLAVRGTSNRVHFGSRVTTLLPVWAAVSWGVFCMLLAEFQKKEEEMVAVPSIWIPINLWPHSVLILRAGSPVSHLVLASPESDHFMKHRIVWYYCSIFLKRHTFYLDASLYLSDLQVRLHHLGICSNLSDLIKPLLRASLITLCRLVW